MKRVWLIDDGIPMHELFGRGRVPLRLEREVLELLLERVPHGEWPEPTVGALCRELCCDDFEPAFFTSPGAARTHLRRGEIPPDVVIFDWEGPGFTPEVNSEALGELLRRTATYVQVYTHLPEEAVEAGLHELRQRYGARILRTQTKTAVGAAQLKEIVRTEWAGTIAGEVADDVRMRARAAVEYTLAEISTMPQAGIAAVVQGREENLLNLLLAKVRDHLGAEASDILTGITEMAVTRESSDALRRLVSAWYYYFPPDHRVRRGDLIETAEGDGTLRFVVTPSCDLAQFRKKTAGRLTVLTAVPLDGAGMATLHGARMLPTSVGHSITAPVRDVSDGLVPLPDVPMVNGSREQLEDFMLVCHSWESIIIPAGEGSDPKAPLRYADGLGLRRRCTLAEPFASAAVAKVSSVIFSPGVPNIPEAERDRLKQKLKDSRPA